MGGNADACDACDSNSSQQAILERSRTALWRLIHATAKSSSSLNTYHVTYQIPVFLDPRQCNVKHFHVRENFWGYGSYPGRPPSKRTYFGRSASTNAANSLSIAPVQLRFQIFLEQLQCNVKHFHVHEKKIGSYLVAVNPFAAFVTFLVFCEDRQQARALVCDDTAESIDAVSMGSAATSGASGFLLATAPRLAPATQRRRAPPLGASSRAPPAASAARWGRMVQGLHVHMRAACDKTATTARPTRRAAPSPPAARW